MKFPRYPSMADLKDDLRSSDDARFDAAMRIWAKRYDVYQQELEAYRYFASTQSAPTPNRVIKGGLLPMGQS